MGDRFVLKERTVIDVIDMDVVGGSDGVLDGAITTFRSEEREAAEEHVAELNAALENVETEGE